MDGNKMKHISEAMKIYLTGKRAYHVVNWETFIANPVGVAEHGDFMETLEKELEQIARYDELLATLEKLNGS
jgi:hypothetical protein